MKSLVLASASPRRIQFLHDWGFQFQSIPANLSETPDKNLTAEEQILQISRTKAEAIQDEMSKLNLKPVILSADTEVVLDQELLGKPANPRHASEILSRLSGRVHRVMTGLWIIDMSTTNVLSHLETSLIEFRLLTEQEIDDYVQSGEPMDKAGAYAIQGMGRNFIRNFTGSYENIVGLPKEACLQLLSQCGVHGSK
jgi:septum formation protein